MVSKSEDEKMIPVTILTGFLGSGKSFISQVIVFSD
jgi:hypothetical protein